MVVRVAMIDELIVNPWTGDLKMMNMIWRSLYFECVSSRAVREKMDFYLYREMNCQKFGTLVRIYSTWISFC